MTTNLKITAISAFSFQVASGLKEKDFVINPSQLEEVICKAFHRTISAGPELLEALNDKRFKAPSAEAAEIYAQVERLWNPISEELSVSNLVTKPSSIGCLNKESLFPLMAHSKAISLVRNFSLEYARQNEESVNPGYVERISFHEDEISERMDFLNNLTPKSKSKLLLSNFGERFPKEEITAFEAIDILATIARDTPLEQMPLEVRHALHQVEALLAFFADELTLIFSSGFSATLEG